MTTRFVAGLVCAALVLGLLGVGPVAAQGKKVEVRIGWQPPGGAGAFVDALMI
jgi:ABC-type sugar transport system substrate-binding protein